MLGQKNDTLLPMNHSVNQAVLKYWISQSEVSH